MRSSLRVALLFGTVAAAFAGGWFIQEVRTKEASAPVVAQTAKPRRAIEENKKTEEVRPKSDVADIKIPTTPPTPLQSIEVNPNDPTLKAIQSQLGIKTNSILDDAKPLPIILTSQKSDAPSEVQLPALPGEAPKHENKKVGAPPLLEIPSLPPPSLHQPRRAEEPKKTEAVAPPPRLIFTNTRDVQLAFTPTKVGASGIKFVEIWSARDGGKWEKLDRVANAPVLRTTMAGEGRFGLKLVLESESGMRTPQPSDHTLPDVYVVVDLTVPTVNIIPLRASKEDGRVKVIWYMKDTNLMPAETRLEYSTDGKTWRNVEGFDGTKYRGLLVDGDDSHSFDWTVPQGMAHQVMMRVTARDAAGNVGIGQLPQKVSVDLVVPQGRIVNVLTAGAPERGPQPREVITFPTLTWFNY